MSKSRWNSKDYARVTKDALSPRVQDVAPKVIHQEAAGEVVKLKTDETMGKFQTAVLIVTGMLLGMIAGVLTGIAIVLAVVR